MSRSKPDATTVVRVAADEPPGELIAALREAVDVPVRAVGSTGATALEPLVAVTDGDGTAFYAGASAADADDVAAALADGTAAGADAVVEHDPAPGRFPVPDLRPFGVGVRGVLGPCGWVDPTDPDDYAASGGFAALDRPAGEALGAVAALRGRGWGDGAADEPVGDLWRSVRGGDDPAVVVNAGGSHADRLLLRAAPLAVVEGALVAAGVVGAGDVVIAVADDLARERVREAVDALPQSGAIEGLGGIDPAVEVVAAPEAYRAAEPTMALEAIEGADRVEARLRPPGPAEHGLRGRPTLVHTPRTLVQVERAAAADDPPEPTRLVSVTGDVAAPATVELPRDAALSRALDAVDVDGTFKAARVGGAFGGFAAHLDVAARADALAAAGLGTGDELRVLNGGRCLLAAAGERARFAKTENCGRCVPCREGSKQLLSLLRDVYGGDYQPGTLRELLRVMEASSVCAFGAAATRPAASLLDAFEPEVEAHAAGRCPAGECDMAAEVPA